jgi:hypothetical protein
MIDSQLDFAADLGNFSECCWAHDNRSVLEKRNSRRSKMVLAVKVSLDAATHLVHTLDITDTGAQLGGLRAQLEPGMMISSQRGRQKAKFRIAWIRQLAPNELRAGVESLEPKKKIWGLELSDRKDGCNKYTNAVMTVLTRRSE